MVPFSRVNTAPVMYLRLGHAFESYFLQSEEAETHFYFATIRLMGATVVLDGRLSKATMECCQTDGELHF